MFFRPQILNTFTVGFSRASFASWIRFPLATFDPSNLSLCHRSRARRDRRGRRRHHHRRRDDHFRGPEQRRGRSRITEIFLLIRTIVQISKGIHQISVGVWFQRLQDNEDTASRQLGQATFASLTTFFKERSARISFKSCPCTPSWAGEACSARGTSGFHPAAAQSHVRGRDCATNSPPAGMKHTEGPPTT